MARNALLTSTLHDVFLILKLYSNSPRIKTLIGDLFSNLVRFQFKLSEIKSSSTSEIRPSVNDKSDI